MSDEEIVDSITWHYIVTDRLNGAQLDEHKRRGACPACEHGTPLTRAGATVPASRPT